MGTIRTVQLLADSVEINSLGERFLIPPFGLNGGDPGGCNALHVKQGEQGEWQTIDKALGTPSPSKFNGLRSGPDSWFRMVSGGGGGYGAAVDRPAWRVVDDVVQGFVSREKAQTEYGVVITTNEDHSLGHDSERTNELRAEMRMVPRDRQLARQHAVDRAIATTRRQELSDEARQIIEATEERIAALAARLRNAVGDDEASRLGASLKTPFTNERAIRFWDLDSLERWLQRHGDKASTLHEAD